MKKRLIPVVAVTILFLVGACSKKEEKPIAAPPPVAQGPIMESPGLPPGHDLGQKLEFSIVLPDDVKDKWSSVKLLIEDMEQNKAQELTVKLGGETRIPDSKLTIKVGDFFPDFRMSGQVITSASNNPNNPAVGVKILEDGAQIFPQGSGWGWLYSQYPTIHPFQHARFRVTLKEGIKKQ